MSVAANDTQPILYSFRRCPYAMRARMALLSADLQVELREVLLRDKPADMLAASPKGTVPVLVLSDGTVLEESLDVMHWALDANDPGNWRLSENPQAFDGARALIKHIDSAFKPHLDRYKYAERHDPAARDHHRDAGLSMLVNALASRLETSTFLFRETASFADIAIFPFVRQFANTDRDWFDKAAPARLVDWLDRLVSTPLFAATMAKFPRWTGQNGIRFPARALGV